MARACGCARFAWNWAVAEWEKRYKNGEKPNGNSLNKQFNAIKRKEFPWILESPKDASQRPFINLNKAYKNFFSKKAMRPRFKSKGNHDVFYVSNTHFWVDDFIVKLPVIGTVRACEKLRFTGKIMSGLVSREGNRWFISVQVELGNAYTRALGNIANNDIGVDLGITTTLACSNGQLLSSPMPLRAHLIKLKRVCRAHSKKKIGSKNRNKSKMRLSRLHTPHSECENGLGAQSNNQTGS